MKLHKKQFVSTLLLAALPCAPARAQCFTDPLTGQRICTRQVSPCRPVAEPQYFDSSAHCRVSLNDGTLGSGSLLAGNESIGLVLTCAHLFNSSQANIVVSFPSGRRFAANLIDVDQANDLAALAIRRPDLAPLAICETEPAGVLTACGYGSNGVFRNICGAITGHPTASGATFPSTTIAGAVRPGDSGGAALNAAGQLVGVVWGQQGGQTYLTCGQPVREFLARIRIRLCNNTIANAKPANPPTQSPSPQFDWQTWTNELDARLRTLDAKKQERGDYLRPGDLNRYLKIDDAAKITDQLAPRSEVDTKLSAITAKFESVHHIAESVRHHVDQLASARTNIVEGLSIGKVLAAALGLSSPLAIAAVALSTLAARRRKLRIKRDEPLPKTSNSPSLRTNPSTLKPSPIAIDTPPPPQRTLTETHFVPIEQDSFAKAHQWASEHVARKYPGATEVLQTQDSLIKQYLAAK